MWLLYYTAAMMIMTSGKEDVVNPSRVILQQSIPLYRALIASLPDPQDCCVHMCADIVLQGLNNIWAGSNIFSCRAPCICASSLHMLVVALQLNSYTLCFKLYTNC
jgi:hypothetical protein